MQRKVRSGWGVCWLFSVIVYAGLSACTTLPTAPELPACEVIAARGDARPVPGFAGLASQRVWADLAQESQLWSRPQWQDFLGRLRDVALHAGHAEFGAGVADDCVAAHMQQLWPAAQSAVDARRRRALVAALQLPDEYSTLQRALGGYPLAAPFLAAGIRGYQQEFAQQWDRFPAQPWTEYVSHSAGSAPATARALATAYQDKLGVVAVAPSLSQALARDFAPSWVVSGALPEDRPGRPQAQPLGVDIAQPAVYWRLDYTRLHGRVLAQLSWVLWFAERPPQSRWDPYSGALDGLVWRTTFGLDGWPLVHDSIHPCGCYHLVFPVRHAPRPPQLGAWQEARLQPAPRLQSALLRLFVRPGDHMLVAVQSRQNALQGKPSRLSLEPWSQARKALQPRINKQGVIAGSERGERWWLWPSGVRSAGAMRDWGRHATAFLGRQHFDDARVLEAYVEPTAVWP